MCSNSNQNFLLCLNVLPSIYDYSSLKHNAESNCYATCTAWLSPYVTQLINYAAIQFALQLYYQKQVFM